MFGRWTILGYCGHLAFIGVKILKLHGRIAALRQAEPRLKNLGSVFGPGEALQPGICGVVLTPCLFLINQIKE